MVYFILQCREGVNPPPPDKSSTAGVVEVARRHHVMAELNRKHGNFKSRLTIGVDQSSSTLLWMKGAT